MAPVTRTHPGEVVTNVLVAGIEGLLHVQRVSEEDLLTDPGQMHFNMVTQHQGRGAKCSPVDFEPFHILILHHTSAGK